jgi:putative tricarboxylic transport membrane protein
MRRALIRTAGDISPFFTRPISLILILLIVLTIMSRVKPFKRFVSVAMTKMGKLFRKRKY